MEVPKSERPRIEDLISYTKDEYFSEEEFSLLRTAFNGPQGAKLLKIVRKVFIPTITDPELPIENIGLDGFLSVVDFKSMPDAEVKPIVLALQLYAKAISGGLIKLRDMANIKDESPAERAARLSKDSTK